jgi:hypothetical protein
MTRYDRIVGPFSRTALVLAAAFVGMPAPPASAAQEVDVGSVLEATRRPLVVDAEGLRGAGGEWLTERAAAAHFTLIGESHLNAETPRLTEALLAALRPSGYSAYVVESGPESTRLLMEAVAEGGLAGGESVLEPFPFGIAFLDQREELRTAAEALATGYEVWGVDQEFMGSPRLLLQRLGELSDDGHRPQIRSMFDREVAAFESFVQTGDQSGAFLLTASREELDALDEAFPDPESEGARIVRQLRASSEIYRAFVEQRYYDNNAGRVELIKRNFLEHMQRAGDDPLSDRRAVIKAGSVHAGRGRTPMHVYDIGNFAAELAFARGGDSFHVLVLATGSVQADGTFSGWRERSPYLVPAFDLVPEDGPVVFDLSPLRPLLTQRGNLSPELQELQEIALRYDALVLYPRFHPSTPIVAVPVG